jgi:hypothetical protein
VDEKAKAREQVIRSWMLAITKDGGIERFDDLHIDRIDSSWKVRQRWIEGALEAYRIALVVRADLGLQLSVTITFSLESAERRLGIDFATPTEFEQRLDHSPPSLYLFELGQEPWVASMPPDATVEPLDPRMFGEVGGRGYFLEFRGHPDEYYRSVFLAS